MRLELKDIKGGLYEQDYTCSLNDFPELLEMKEQGGPEFIEPLNFHLRFQKSGQIVELDGDLSTEIKLSCGRCLQPFVHKATESFALTFSPVPEQATDEEEVELEADELGLIIYQDEAIELIESLQEQLIMSIPISPLCSGGCQGLCSECGLNLNDDRCTCEKKPFNNKFSALADLKFKG